MTARRRVGVVVLIDAPAGDWIDGVRRAVGDASLDRIRPHVTLVPPLNLRPSDLDAALGRLRTAAAAVDGPLTLNLGPPATFLPANPVLYLGVGGDLPELAALRRAVFAPPLERPLSWPWVPHVTLADDLPPERIPPLVTSLGRFAVTAVVDRLTLLEERHTPDGRRWAALADAALGPPATVGRGGLALTLTAGRIPDPGGAALLFGDAGAPVDPGPAAPVDPGPTAPDRRRVLTAHREGALVGAAVAWLADDGAHVRVVVDPDHRRTGIGGHLLAGVEDLVRRAGWDCPVLHADGPAGFYRARSAWSRVE